MAARRKKSRTPLPRESGRAGRMPAKPAPRAATRRPASWPFAAVLILVGVFAYSNSFTGVFVLDDVRAIIGNATIRTLLPLSTPLSPPGRATVSGRPVANFTFALNYALAPTDARDAFAPGRPGVSPGAADAFLRNLWGYHFLNLLIHLAASLALFGVVRRTLATDRLKDWAGESAEPIAFAVAILWLVHPLQTESVTYIVQRVESLMGLFYLLTIYCAIRASEGRHAAAWAAGAVAACALGMATKEAMVTAPIMVWLWDRTFGPPARPAPWRWPLRAGLAATWLVLAALLYGERRGPSVDLTAGVVWQYLLTQAEVITHYVRLSVVPSPLVFLYTWPLVSSFGAVAPQAAVLAALVSLTAFAIFRRHPLGYVGAWFFLVLAPTSSVLPIVTEVAAEHRMYVPLAAVVVLGVTAAVTCGRWALGRFSLAAATRRRVALGSGMVLTLALAAGLGIETRARNRDYQSDLALWADTVAKQPANWRARVAYGTALMAAGRTAEAEPQFAAAVSLEPMDAVARTRLGTALAAQGRFDAAAVHLERALTLRPDDLDAHRALGLIYAAQRKDARAVPHLERVLAVSPNDPALLARLAAIFADSSDTVVRNGPRALGLAERAAALTSRREPLILDILAVAQASVGRFREAAATAREGLALAQATGQAALASELERRAAAYAARQ